MVKLIWSNLLNQINLIRYTAKFGTFLLDQFFKKIWHVLIHQISWMKNIKSNFKSPQRRKIEENKTTNESTWNIFVARFSFGVLASLIFVIYFVISSFTKTKNFFKHSGIILNFILSPLLNRIQKGEYAPKT